MSVSFLYLLRLNLITQVHRTKRPLYFRKILFVYVERPPVFNCANLAMIGEQAKNHTDPEKHSLSGL